jgi:hypothetical protein
MNNEDKYMLEMAAKAIQKEFYESTIGAPCMVKDSGFVVEWYPHELWNDAGQLAADLNLNISFHKKGVAILESGEFNITTELYEKHNNDKIKAACYAITRAAAEIGRKIK